MDFSFITDRPLWWYPLFALVLLGIFMCLQHFDKLCSEGGYDGKPDYGRFSRILYNGEKDLYLFGGFAFYSIHYYLYKIFKSEALHQQWETYTRWHDELAKARMLFVALPFMADDIINDLSAAIGDKCIALKTKLLADAETALVVEEIARWREFRDGPYRFEDLALYQERLRDPDLRKKLTATMLDAFARLFSALPDYIGEPAIFHAALPNAITSPKPIDDFFHAFQRDDKLLWSIFSSYTENWYSVRKQVEAKFIEPNSPHYFRAIVPPSFTSLTHGEVPITIPPQLRFEGVWIIAPPGRGKTTLLSKLLSVDLEKVARGEASVILMDSKGDLIDHVRRLKRFAPGGDLEGKLVLIEPNANLALNPLDLGASAGHKLALSEYILDGLLDMATTPKQGSVFRHILTAMFVIPGATFATMIQFLHDWKPFEEFIRTLPPDDSAYFLNGIYDSTGQSGNTGTRQELYWRIDGMMTKVPLVRSMLKSPSTKLDIGKEMDAGKVIIIDNSAAKLAAGTEFFSRFFVALILAAAQQRAGRKDEEKLPCYFYIDECDTVVARDTKIAEIIVRCRSQKIGMVLAHQFLGQIENEKVLDAITNSAVRLANSDDDAAALSSKMRTTVEELRKLKRGQFALFMRDNTSKAIVVDVPNKPVSDEKHWPKMSDAEFAAIQQEMDRRYCFTPEPEPIIMGFAGDTESGPVKW